MDHWQYIGFNYLWWNKYLGCIIDYWYDLFISTATPTNEIKKILNHNDLISYFKDVKGSPESKIDHVNQIISNNHFSLDEIIFLGDSGSDKEAADKNDIQFVAVNDNKKLANVKFRLNNLVDLDKMINTIENQEKN